MPDSTLLIASSLGELQRGLGKKARAAKKLIWLFRNSAWKNPNELFGQPST